MTTAANEFAADAARTQSLFRAVNERMVSRHERFDPAGTTYHVTCECADGACRELVKVSRAAYATMRHRATRFAVLAGHVVPGVERVVAVATGYVVVEKHGVAGEIAASLAER